MCLDQAEAGFCTWPCVADEDCEEVHPDYLCTSFEDEDGFFCFAGCSDERACPPRFTCRSSGGGAANRKICFPE